MKRWNLSSPFLCLLMGSLYPIIFVLSNNWYRYTSTQIFCSWLVIFTAMLLMNLPVFILLRFSGKSAPLFGGRVKVTALLNVITALIVMFVLFLLMGETLRLILPNAFMLSSLYMLLVMLVVFSVIVKDLRYFTGFLCISVMVASSQFVISYTGSTFTQNQQWNLSDALGKNQSDWQFKEKPNIYLIVLESYHDSATLQDIYQIDNRPMEKDLREMNFAIYPCFSNYAATLASMTSMFSMQHHYTTISRGIDDVDTRVRDALSNSEQNPAIRCLRSNGYRLIYTGESDLLGNFLGLSIAGSNVQLSHRGQRLFLWKRISFFTQPLMEMSQVVSSLFSSLRLALEERLLDADDRYEVLNSIPSFLAEQIQGNINTPTFYLIATGAGHISIRPPTGVSFSDYRAAPWRYQNDFVKSVYPALLATANVKLRQILEVITEKDPTGLVVLIGDHGALRYSEVWLADDGSAINVNEAMRARAVPGTLVARDRFSVLFAINRPDLISKAVPDVISHVNLFPVIFDALSGSNNKGEYAENESFLSAGDITYRAVREGVALNNWEKVAKE